ncbi:MAG: GNAT family N-acetyltransferase [Candidatus Aminicenantes bacterium]|nr:GNAT family N-acetyltransferase [Candidatus Aminicenantes bacterium]
MSIRKAGKTDLSQIVTLAAQYNLDYEGMEADDFWVAEEGDKIVGICGLRRHPDCQELCSLGVEEASQKKGLGRELVHTLLQETGSDICLATVIPEFFQKLGFERAAAVPPSMIKKADWCAGCSRDRCTIMVKRRG